jgi:chorismate mutase/prephenate dehydratase
VKPKLKTTTKSPTAPTAAPTSADLPALREQINRLDKQLIDVLNQRARVVVEVGRYKQAHNIPIYAPHREAEVLKRALASNQGPLSSRTIEAIYRELMSGSFSLEKPLSIGYLGPAGSFSHLAATKHFGSSVTFEDLREVTGVFTEVARGHVDYGLVPIENVLHGGITETLDCLSTHAGKVFVYAEAQLEVHHALLANCEPSKIEVIYSKPEVFSQCKFWLATQYPKAQLIPTASSSKAVQHVAEATGKESQRSAAIGSSLAAQLYGLNVLFDAIEDQANNITRFYVISRQQAEPSGDDKTALCFTTQNKPGALARVLGDFDKAGVNLTHIDKRPARKENWSYTFFIDAEGHQRDASVQQAIESARQHCRDLQVLGSFPRSRRIL